MESTSSAASGRRAASFFVTGAWRLAALVVLGALGVSWSTLVHAQATATCTIGAITTSQQTGPAGGTVSFQLQAGGNACSAGVIVALTIPAASDGTGGATIVAPANPTVPTGTPYTFSVNLGSTPGATGTATATCTAGCTSAVPVNFSFRTANNIQWTPVPASLTLSASQLTTFNFGTQLTINGSPSTFITTTFTNVTSGANYGTVTPNASGAANSGAQSIPGAGTYTLRATPNCPGPTFALPECAALTPHDFTLTVEPVSVTRISAAAVTIASGANTTLTARYGSPSFPQPDGSTLLWSVTQPAGGNGTITPSPVAGGNGQTNAVFTATVPGTYTVTALTTCTFCSPNSTTFTVTVTAIPTLTISGGDGQTSPVGTAYPVDLGVIAQNSGLPAGGVAILWTVTSGAATIVDNGPTDFTGGNASATVTPTAAGPLVIRAERSDAPGVFVTFNLTATAVPTLAITGGNGQTSPVGTAYPVDLGVLAQNSGVGAGGVTILWTVTSGAATIVPNGPTTAGGNAGATVTPTAAGPLVIRAERQDAPGVFVTFNLTATAVPTLAITGGNGQTAMVGDPFPVPLSVLAQNSGVAAAGIGINWAVTSGSATLTAATTTSATGASSNTVTPTAAGPITITATRQDAPGVSVTFTMNATPQPFVLTGVTPNPASGTVAAPMTFTVGLTQGGTPVIGSSIQWSASAPMTPASAASTTGASGQASATFTPTAAGTFANVVTATFNPDGIPANGDEVTYSFGAAIASVPTLAITGGNGQSTLPGNAFALPLQVSAQNSGVPAAGVTIVWTVTGDAALVASGATSATGAASATVTAGATAGPVTITAARQDAPTASVTFNLTVNAFGTLTIVSGDGQTLEAGIPSAPMQVVLKNSAGTPIAGATVSWSTTGGTLGSATSVTNASGVATNTVTVAAAGKVQVTASSPLAGAAAVFSMNGALGNLLGLTESQTEVAEAVDTLCPALAALPTRTPEQNDLLARCRELSDAAGIDPAATIDAIDELLTDVAMAQGQAALIALQAQFQNLKVRIAALRSGTQGVSFGGLALNTPTGPLSLDTLSSAFTQDDTTQAEPTGEIGTDFSRWGFFAAGNIGRGEQDPGDVDPEFDYDIDGLTAGFDYRYKDSWIFGGAFGYTRQDTQLPDDEGSVDTDGWSLSAYTTYYTKDSWYLDGVVTFGRNDYDLVRHIDYTVPLAGGGTSTITQTARASAGGDLLQGAFTFGRDFNKGALGIGPYAKLLYTHIGFDEIEEELEAGPGSGLGLRVEERDLTSLASVIGGKLTYTHSTEWGVLMPHLQLEWEHEFRDDPQRIEASFLHDPTGTGMVVRGDAIDTDYFRFGLGLSMVLAQGRSGFFYYEHLLGREGISQWNLALGLRLEF